MTVVTTRDRSADVEKSPLHIVLAITAMAAESLCEWWHNYRSRQELAVYSHSERSDLSFSAEVDAEIVKPFWKR